MKHVLLRMVIAMFAMATILATVSCESDDGGGEGGILSGTWEGFTVTATNGISVTRDLLMKLSHKESTDSVTGTTRTGNEDARPLVGSFFPESNVLEVSVSTPAGTVKQTWRLEDGGTTLTQVAGGTAQVYRK